MKIKIYECDWHGGWYCLQAWNRAEYVGIEAVALLESHSHLRTWIMSMFWMARLFAPYRWLIFVVLTWRLLYDFLWFVNSNECSKLTTVYYCKIKGGAFYCFFFFLRYCIYFILGCDIYLTIKIWLKYKYF